MKKIKNYIFPSLLLTLFFVLGCSSDFLERPPLGQITAANFPETQDDMILANNAIYNALRSWNINTGGFPLLDIMSDEATKGSNPNDGIAIRPFETFSFDPTESNIDTWYKTMYTAIRRANLVISNLNQVEMDESTRKQIEGESRFLRAYFYSILVRGFGDVPKVEEVDPSLDLLRSPAAEIWSEIVFPDLEVAINNLPEKSEYSDDELGRATKGMAKALRARLALYLKDYSTAETMSLEVINSQQYQLEINYGDAFSSLNEHGPESIFEITAKPESFVLGGNQYANTQGIRGSPNRGWGFCRPAYSYIQFLENSNDPRLDDIVIYLGEVLDGVVTNGDSSTPDTTYEGSTIVEIECYNQKVWYPGTNTTTAFGHNRRVIRYADVLLMAAEALNENDKPGEALVYLNQVRERARGGNSTVLPDITTTNKDELRAFILEERHRELAIEGLRFWDLVRTDRAEEVLGPLGFIKNKNELFPFPQSEIDLSEGKMSQNPGY